MFDRSAVVAIVVAVASLMSVGAYAEGGYYGGNIAFVNYSEEGIGDEASITAIVGRLGTTFNENFSGEVRVGIGLGDDTVTVFGTDVDIELDSMFGVYVRGGMQASATVFPYAILGYTRGEGTASAAGLGSDSSSESDISFGLGADITLNDKFTINVEYMNYMDKDGSEIDGFAVGLSTTF